LQNSSDLSTFCKKCKLNYNEICKYCPREIVFKGLNIASREETLNEIISNNKSIARFGDGEFKIIFGRGIGFHKSSKLLKKGLLNVLNSNLDNLMIGLNIPYREIELNIRPDDWRDYWKKYINKYITKNLKEDNLKIKKYIKESNILDFTKKYNLNEEGKFTNYTINVYGKNVNCFLNKKLSDNGKNIIAHSNLIRHNSNFIHYYKEQKKQII